MRMKSIRTGNTGENGSRAVHDAEPRYNELFSFVVLLFSFHNGKSFSSYSGCQFYFLFVLERKKSLGEVTPRIAVSHDAKQKLSRIGVESIPGQYQFARVPILGHAESYSQVVEFSRVRYFYC